MNTEAPNPETHATMGVSIGPGTCRRECSVEGCTNRCDGYHPGRHICDKHRNAERREPFTPRAALRAEVEALKLELAAAPLPGRGEAADNERPTCDTPGCGRAISAGGEGHPEICSTCLACLKLHEAPSRAEAVRRARADALKDATNAIGEKLMECCSAGVADMATGVLAALKTVERLSTQPTDAKEAT